MNVSTLCAKIGCFPILFSFFNVLTEFKLSDTSCHEPLCSFVMFNWDAFIPVQILKVKTSMKIDHCKICSHCLIYVEVI